MFAGHLVCILSILFAESFASGRAACALSFWALRTLGFLSMTLNGLKGSGAKSPRGKVDVVPSIACPIPIGRGVVCLILD